MYRSSNGHEAYDTVKPMDEAEREGEGDYLVIDVEATCDADHALARDETEIIEIGAVRVDRGTLEPAEEFQTFVRPVRHPVLTPFCTELTHIAQADVDRAPGFTEALTKLRDFMDGRALQFASWGDYDRNQFARDAAWHAVELPFRGPHLNVRRRFSAALGETRRYGMDEALARVGLVLHGVHHRGLDDARNIARLLPWALGRARS